MNYRVVKPFGCAEVGDIFTLREGDDVYTMHFEKADYESRIVRDMMLNENTMQEYIALGIVEEVKEEKTDDKIKKALDTITKLKEIYNHRNNKMQSKYDAGKLPTCQKVEHDTVYFNMMKLLNKIESILNE